MSAIVTQRALDSPCEVVKTIQETKGTTGFYELAKELTYEFEKKFEGKEWDGEFFDEIEKFIQDKKLTS